MIVVLVDLTLPFIFIMSGFELKDTCGPVIRRVVNVNLVHVIMLSSLALIVAQVPLSRLFLHAFGHCNTHQPTQVLFVFGLLLAIACKGPGVWPAEL